MPETAQGVADDRSHSWPHGYNDELAYNFSLDQGLQHDAWRPAVEITILAVAIYYVLMFVRGTRGWSVAIGFLLLMAVTLVAYELKLGCGDLAARKVFPILRVRGAGDFSTGIAPDAF